MQIWYQSTSLPACHLASLASYTVSLLLVASVGSQRVVRLDNGKGGKEKSGPLGKMPSQKASSSWPGGMDPISAEACAGGGRALQTQGKHLNSPNKQTNKLIPLLQNTYPVYLVLEGAFIATIKVGLHESLG